MNKNFSIYLNWRLHIIFGLGFVALIMACDETERALLSFFAIKAAAACLGITAYRLAKYWHSKGYFNDVDEFCSEED